MRYIYALPTAPILFPCILFSHSFSSLWIWPGGSYLCDQAAVNRAGWQTAEEPEMWNSISRTPQNTKMKLRRESWHTLNSVDAQWLCNQVMLLYKPPCPSENVTFFYDFVFCLSFLFSLCQKYTMKRYMGGESVYVCVDVCSNVFANAFWNREREGDTARKERQGES